MFKKKHTPSPTIYPEELEFSVSWKIFQNFGTISSTNFFCSSAFKKIVTHISNSMLYNQPLAYDGEIDFQTSRLQNMHPVLFFFINNHVKTF